MAIEHAVTNKIEGSSLRVHGIICVAWHGMTHGLLKHVTAMGNVGVRRGTGLVQYLTFLAAN